MSKEFASKFFGKGCKGRTNGEIVPGAIKFNWLGMARREKQIFCDFFATSFVTFLQQLSATEC
jgi:hypothetical protein